MATRYSRSSNIFDIGPGYGQDPPKISSSKISDLDTTGRNNYRPDPDMVKKNLSTLIQQKRDSVQNKFAGTMGAAKNFLGWDTPQGGDPNEGQGQTIIPPQGNIGGGQPVSTPPSDAVADDGAAPANYAVRGARNAWDEMSGKFRGGGEPVVEGPTGIGAVDRAIDLGRNAVEATADYVGRENIQGAKDFVRDAAGAVAENPFVPSPIKEPAEYVSGEKDVSASNIAKSGAKVALSATPFGAVSQAADVLAQVTGDEGMKDLARRAGEEASERLPEGVSAFGAGFGGAIEGNLAKNFQELWKNAARVLGENANKSTGGLIPKSLGNELVDLVDLVASGYNVIGDPLEDVGNIFGDASEGLAKNANIPENELAYVFGGAAGDLLIALAGGFGGGAAGTGARTLSSVLGKTTLGKVAKKALTNSAVTAKVFRKIGGITTRDVKNAVTFAAPQENRIMSGAYDRAYQKALEDGMTESEANRIALQKSVAVGGASAAPTVLSSLFLVGGSGVGGAISAALAEGSEEASQEAMEAAIIGDELSLKDLGYAALVGGAFGAGANIAFNKVGGRVADSEGGNVFDKMQAKYKKAKDFAIKAKSIYDEDITAQEKIDKLDRLTRESGMTQASKQLLLEKSKVLSDLSTAVEESRGKEAKEVIDKAIEKDIVKPEEIVTEEQSGSGGGEPDVATANQDGRMVAQVENITTGEVSTVPVENPIEAYEAANKMGKDWTYAGTEEYVGSKLYPQEQVIEATQYIDNNIDNTEAIDQLMESRVPPEGVEMSPESWSVAKEVYKNRYANTKTSEVKNALRQEQEKVQGQRRTAKPLALSEVKAKAPKTPDNIKRMTDAELAEDIRRNPLYAKDGVTSDPRGALLKRSPKRRSAVEKELGKPIEFIEEGQSGEVTQEATVTPDDMSVLRYDDVRANSTIKFPKKLMDEVKAMSPDDMAKHIVEHPPIVDKNGRTVSSNDPNIRKSNAAMLLLKRWGKAKTQAVLDKLPPNGIPVRQEGGKGPVAKKKS